MSTFIVCYIRVTFRNQSFYCRNTFNYVDYFPRCLDDRISWWLHPSLVSDLCSRFLRLPRFLLRIPPTIHKASASADFETLMLSRYETALLTLWHSRRGQGAAVHARKSRLHERVNISLTRSAIYALRYSPVVFVASQTSRVM